MLVATSRNGVTYALAGQALGEQEDTLVADFVPPVMARYVVVRAGGRCRLSLDEVEVFPPEK